MHEKDFNILYIKKLDNFFKKQNRRNKLEIFKEKRNQYFKLKNLTSSSNDNIALELESYYYAIDYFYCLHRKAKSKNKSMSTYELKKFNEFSIESSLKSRVSKKEAILLDKSSIINHLLIANASLRDISNYLKSYHRVYISHTYVSRILKKYPQIFKKV